MLSKDSLIILFLHLMRVFEVAKKGCPRITGIELAILTTLSV